jgi:hypothetical protein
MAPSDSPNEDGQRRTPQVSRVHLPYYQIENARYDNRSILPIAISLSNPARLN